MFLVCILCCATIITVQFQNFPFLKRSPIPISSHPPLPPPQSLTTRNPLCVSADRPVLDVSHQWSHTQCALLCLPLSLSVVFSGSCQCITPFCVEKCSPARRDPAWGLFCSWWVFGLLPLWLWWCVLL